MRETMKARRDTRFCYSLIIETGPHSFLDHWDGDGLDCRRNNIRVYTNAQNPKFTRPRARSSAFRDVSWIQARKKWFVAFRDNGRYHYVGYLTDKEQAAMAYDASILPLAGEFARREREGG